MMDYRWLIVGILIKVTDEPFWKLSKKEITNVFSKSWK